MSVARVAADDIVFVGEGDELVVFDIDRWMPVSRTRVGSALVPEIVAWNDPPEGSAARRDAVLARLDRTRIPAAMRAVDAADLPAYARRIRRAQEFAALAEGGLPLPAWHRFALAKHALFRRRYVAWGIPDAAELWPDVDMSVGAGFPGGDLDASAVHVIDDLAVASGFVDAFEEAAVRHGIARMHLADDGSTLRVGPTLIGAEGGPWHPEPMGRGRPVGRLAAAIVDRELLFADPRIAGAMTEELSATLGRVFELRWRDLSAREHRVG